MTQMQPLDVLGIVLEPIQIILGQIEQKLSKKAKNTKLAITLNCTSGMNSFLETNDNFCMQKQWQVQKNKQNFLREKKLNFLIHVLLIYSMIKSIHLQLSIHRVNFTDFTIAADYTLVLRLVLLLRSWYLLWFFFASRFPERQWLSPTKELPSFKL